MILAGVEYPLSGTAAEVSFGLEVVLIYISFQMFGLFMYRYMKSRKKDQNLRNLAWSMNFLGYGCTYIFYIVADYFADPSIRDTYSEIGYIALTTGITLYALLSERTEGSKWYPVTIFCGFFMILSIISVSLGYRDLTLKLAFFAVPVAAVYIIRYFYKYAKITNFNRQILKKIAGLFLSLLIVLAGYFFVTDQMSNLLGSEIRILSASLNILGVLLFMNAISKLPDYREFVWMKKTRALFIVKSSGILLFNRFWKKDDAESNEMLIGSALTSVKTVINTITDEESIYKLELEDKSLLFHIDEEIDIVACIIAEEYVPSLHDRLKTFSERFKKMFKPVLKDWNGNIDVFTPAESLCDDIFMREHKNQEIYDTD